MDMPKNKNITFSDDEALSYIQNLENPHRVGWDGKVWRTPKEKGFDKNQIAYGLDIRQKHNPIVYNFLKSRGRLGDPWLTDAEAKQLTAQTFAQKKDSIAKAIAIAGGNVSQEGYNRLAGMAWHGHPMKMLLDKDSLTGKAFRKEIANGGTNFTRTFDTYYSYGSNAKQFADRMKQDQNYRTQYVVDNGDYYKKIIINPKVYQKPKQYESTWQPEQPTKTIYPLNNTTPESISSWSGADAPNATPRLKDFQEVRQEDLNRGIGVYGDPVSPFSLSLRPPSLQKMLQNQTEQYFADALGVSDIMPEMPSLFPRFKNGKLPGYEDGTIPGLGPKKNIKPKDLQLSTKEERGLETAGPIEKALIAWLGGRAITGGLSMYNRARAFKQAKETYRQARQWNEQTRDASRAWKIADADQIARNSLYSGSSEPLGWLYDTLLRPVINTYDKLNQSPIGIILP